ncbi:MAG: secretin N-terminal domain-containing protein [Verrucomicrobiota bacterium]
MTTFKDLCSATLKLLLIAGLVSVQRGYGQSETQSFKIVPDDRTGVLMIVSNPEHFILYDKIIDLLDRPVDLDIDLQIHRLKVAKAVDVGRALQEELSEPTKVLVDERANTLVLAGVADDLKTLRKTVEQLDVRHDQVLLELIVFQVDLDEKITRGIDWVRETFPGSADGAPVKMSGTSGSWYIVANNLNLEGLLHRAVNSPRARVLSTPVVLTTDRTEATIHVGEERPVVSTTGTSTTMRSAYEYRPVGLGISLTPTVNPDTYLDVDLRLTRDTVGGYADIDGHRIPIMTREEIAAKINLKRPGRTVVAGGATTTEEHTREVKVPLLGHIPLVGRLFRSKKTIKEERETLIVLTPTVLSDPQEIEAHTKRFQGASMAR